MGRADRHPTDDLLLDFAHRLLPGEEECELLAHLEECAPCEERFRAMAGEIERLRAGADEALRGAAATAAATKAGAKEGRLPERRGFRFGPLARVAWGLGAVAAAACVVLMVHTVAHRGPSSDAAALLSWLPAAGETVVTRDPHSAKPGSALEAGLAAYARHDARAAAKHFAEAHESGDLAEIARVYYGSALAWSGDFPGAARELGGLDPRFLPEPWRGETRWTLFVALRESGRAASADSLLRELAAGKGEVAERARRLMGARR